MYKAYSFFVCCYSHPSRWCGSTVAGKIFAEVLPYLNIKKADEENKAQIKVPDLKGKTIKEAEKILKENNLKIELDENEIDKEKIITKQIPEKEILVDEETSIIVHTN